MQLIIILLISIIAFMPPVFACTDFQIKANDGAIITARSMEWGVDMQSQLHIYPRHGGAGSWTCGPGGSYGASWVKQYGYVGADCYKRDMVIDGMNEKGLSVGGLWFPGAVYQNPNPEQHKDAINVLDLSGWMLAQFATIDEVKFALKNIVVFAQREPEIKAIPTIHFALHDAQGKNAVIEFIDGKLQFYDNPNGVLTNAPSFDWHMTNLCNYLMLSPDNPRPITVGNTVLAPPGRRQWLYGHTR